MSEPTPRIPYSILFVIATGGVGGISDRLMHGLAEASGVAAEYVYVDKTLGARTDLRRLVAAIADSPADAVIVKGLGWRGGLAAMLAKRRTKGRRGYFVTAGDAIGSYERNNHGRVRGWLGDLFERALYRNSLGFIGRTGYHLGRAIRMGAPTGITIEGFVPSDLVFTGRAPQIRRELGIPAGAIVAGVTGSIVWSERQRYAYGLDLVNAARLVDREDIYFLIVGDGTGLDRLKALASQDLRFRFTGRVPHAEMADYLQVLDVALIGQTQDETGLLRSTTKLPEYLAAGVPVIMSAVPAVFDYVDQRGDDVPIIPVPLDHPGSERFAQSVAAILRDATRDDLSRRGRRATASIERFDLGLVAARLVPYLQSVLSRAPGGPTDSAMP